MVQTEQPLYPKLSSIYNKIMQLAIAIMLMIAVMNILIFSGNKTEQVFEQQFVNVAQDYTQNVANTIAVLLTAKKSSRDNSLLTQYLQNLPQAAMIHDAIFYDASGQINVSSKQAKSIKELYGINQYRINRSAEFIPFVSEIRLGKEQKLHGYLRLTIKKAYIMKTLVNNDHDNHQFIRLMLIMAGFIGFLLTRGLNRFSRQGYRVHRP